jgi:hypothetical protein
MIPAGFGHNDGPPLDEVGQNGRDRLQVRFDGRVFGWCRDSEYPPGIWANVG